MREIDNYLSADLRHNISNQIQQLHGSHTLFVPRHDAWVFDDKIVRLAPGPGVKANNPEYELIPLEPDIIYPWLRGKNKIHGKPTSEKGDGAQHNGETDLYREANQYLSMRRSRGRK